MDYCSILENERENFKKTQSILTKNDLLYIANKDSLKSKFHGFLTLSYHQREKLIKTGELFYGYVFSEWNSRPETWPISLILFSPERKIAENPIIFKEIVEELQGFLEISPKSKEEKKFKKLLSEPLANAPFEMLPSSLSRGHVIYFCKVYRNISFDYSFNLGLNLFIVNPAISKQILFLPKRYMTETFRNLYQERKLML